MLIISFCLNNKDFKVEMNRLFSEKNATLQSAEICSRLEDFSPWLGWACVCCVHLYWSWLTNVPSSRGPGSAVITRPQLRRIIHTHHLSTVHSQHYTNYHWPALEVSLLLRIARVSVGQARLSTIVEEKKLLLSTTLRSTLLLARVDISL